MLLLFTVVAARAVPDPPDLAFVPVSQSSEMQEYCFPSGMRVLLQQHRTHPVLSVVAMYDGGAADDPAGQEGLAHLAEHLWFRSNDGHVDVSAALDRIGADWNGETRPDGMAFESLAPIDAARALLELEARRMTDPLAGVDEATVAVERGVLHGEWLSGSRPLTDQAMPALARVLYPPDWRTARPETAESLGRVALDDLRRFAGEHWRPEHATLVLAGDFTFPQLLALFVETMPRALLVGDGPDDGGPIRADGTCPGRLPAERRDPPALPASGEAPTVPGPVDHPVVVLGWTLPGAYREDDQTLQIAASWFEARLRGSLADMDAAEAASCALTPGAEASTLTCTVTVRSLARADRVRAFVKDAIASFRDDPSEQDAETLKRYQRQVFFALQVGTEDVASFGERTSALATHAHVTGSATYSADVFTSLKAVTVEEVHGTIARWVTPQRMATVVISPSGAAATGWTEHTSLVAPTFDAPDPGPADAAALRHRLAAPDLSRIQSDTLSNGLKVVVVPIAGAPRAYVGLVLPSGDLAREHPLLPELAWYASDWWAGNPALVDGPAKFVGSWLDAVDPRGFRLAVSGSSGNLEAELYLLRLRLDNHRVIVQRRPEFARFVRQSTRHARHGENVEIADRIAEAWPGPPYQPLTEQLAAIKNREVRAFAKAVVQPANATLVVVGDVDGHAAIAYAEDWFGDWAPGRVPPAGPAVRNAAGSAEVRDRTVLAVTDERWPAASVLVACAVDEPLTGALLGHVLERDGWRELRAAHGQVYGVWTGVSSGGGADVLEMGTLAPADQAGSVVVALTDLLDGASDSEAAAIDLARFDEIRAASALFARQADVFDLVTDRMLRGLPVDTMLEYPATVAGIDGAAVGAEAERCAGHELVLVWGPSAAAASLTAAGVAYEAVGTVVPED